MVVSSRAQTVQAGIIYPIHSLYRTSSRLTRPLGRLDGWKSFHRDITICKRDARQSVRVGVLAERRILVHAFAICITRSIGNVDNAGPTELLAFAVCPSRDALVDINAIVD